MNSRLAADNLTQLHSRGRLAGIVPARPQLHTVTASLAILAMVLLYYIHAWGSITGFVTILDDRNPLAADFLAFYYPAGQNVLDVTRACHPPLGFLYPLFFALCLVPISSLAPQTAVFVWTLLGVAVAVALFLLPVRHILRTSRPAYYVYLLAFLLSVPVLDCIKWGQVSNLVVLCILACLYLYHKGYERLAAGVLSVPIAIKVYPALFLVHFLFKRDYRFLVVCGMSVALLVFVIPVWIVGLGQWVEFHYTLYDHLNTIRHAVRNHDKIQYLPYLVYHWIHGTVHDVAQVALLRRICLGIVAINLLLVNRLIKRQHSDGIFWSFVLLFNSLPLLVESSWLHYFGWLPFGQAFLCMSFAGRKVTTVDAAKIVLLLFPSIVLGSMLALNWAGDFRVAQRSGFILIADMLLLVLTWLQMPSVRTGDYLGYEQPDPSRTIKARQGARARGATAAGSAGEEPSRTMAQPGRAAGT